MKNIGKTNAGAAEPRFVRRKMQEAVMIMLTRLNGQSFVLNAEKIRYVESTPDTMVCTESGERLIVKEPLVEVMKRAIDYARTIRRAITE